MKKFFSTKIGNALYYRFSCVPFGFRIGTDINQYITVSGAHIDQMNLSGDIQEISEKEFNKQLTEIQKTWEDINSHTTNE